MGATLNRRPYVVSSARAHRAVYVRAHFVDRTDFDADYRLNPLLRQNCESQPSAECVRRRAVAALMKTHAISAGDLETHPDRTNRV